jgi:hypothetical protein
MDSGPRPAATVAACSSVDASRETHIMAGFRGQSGGPAARYRSDGAWTGATVPRRPPRWELTGVY